MSRRQIADEILSMIALALFACGAGLALIAFSPDTPALSSRAGALARVDAAPCFGAGPFSSPQRQPRRIAQISEPKK